MPRARVNVRSSPDGSSPERLDHDSQPASRGNAVGFRANGQNATQADCLITGQIRPHWPQPRRRSPSSQGMDPPPPNRPAQGHAAISRDEIPNLQRDYPDLSPADPQQTHAPTGIPAIASTDPIRRVRAAAAGQATWPTGLAGLLAPHADGGGDSSPAKDWIRASLRCQLR
jgi:hypothetical protein